MWWATCAACGEQFRDPQRFTAESMLRAHEVGKHQEPGDPS